MSSSRSWTSTLLGTPFNATSTRASNHQVVASPILDDTVGMDFGDLTMSKLDVHSMSGRTRRMSPSGSPPRKGEVSGDFTEPGDVGSHQRFGNGSQTPRAYILTLSADFAGRQRRGPRWSYLRLTMMKRASILPTSPPPLIRSESPQGENPCWAAPQGRPAKGTPYAAGGRRRGWETRRVDEAKGGNDEDAQSG